jgi:hypothetical protein
MEVDDLRIEVFGGAAPAGARVQERLPTDRQRRIAAAARGRMDGLREADQGDPEGGGVTIVTQPSQRQWGLTVTLVGLCGLFCNAFFCTTVQEVVGASDEIRLYRLVGLLCVFLACSGLILFVKEK